VACQHAPRECLFATGVNPDQEIVASIIVQLIEHTSGPACV